MTVIHVLRVISGSVMVGLGHSSFQKFSPKLTKAEFRLSLKCHLGRF